LSIFDELRANSALNDQRTSQISNSKHEAVFSVALKFVKIVFFGENVYLRNNSIGAENERVGSIRRFREFYENTTDHDSVHKCAD
jgi:hypothetical protein